MRGVPFFEMEYIGLISKTFLKNICEKMKIKKNFNKMLIFYTKKRKREARSLVQIKKVPEFVEIRGLGKCFRLV
jgi:hypothetical protein